MTREQANALKEGDVILVKVRVGQPMRPGTAGHERGWINCDVGGELLSEQTVIVSCDDAVTGADLRTWIEERRKT